MTIADLIAYRTGERTETLLRTVLRLQVDFDRDTVKALISAWAASHIPARLGQPDLTLAPGASVEGPPRWATAVGEDAFALHLAHADRDVARRTWITDLAVADEIDSLGLPALDLTLSVRQPVGAISPHRQTPRVLRLIGEAVGLYDGATRLQTTPKGIDRTNIGELFEMLHDPHRNLPMIVISPPYALDATELTRSVYGAAHVLLLDGMSTWRLGDELGPHWRVFDGAVRIFGPLFAADDRPERHPRWLGRTIEGINHRAARAQESDFTAIIARHVFATAAAAAGEIPVTNVDSLELRRFARKREAHAAIETAPATPNADDPAPPPSGPPGQPSGDEAASSMDGPAAGVVETVEQKLALIQSDMESLEATLARKDVEIAELRTMLFESRRRADELERAYLEIERAYIDLSESNSSGSTISGLRALANDVPSAAPLVSAIEAMLAQTHEMVAQARELDRRVNEGEEALRAARSHNAWLAHRLSNQSQAPTETGLPAYADADGFSAFVAERYEGRVLLHPRALSRWSEGQYADRPHLLAALDLLGNEYHAMRLREADDFAPRQRYLDGLAELGLHDGGAISDTAFGQYREHYEVEWRGQAVRITDHLRNNGNTHDPARCLAIYFFWDDAISATVICALPAHLPNAFS